MLWPCSDEKCQGQNDFLTSPITDCKRSRGKRPLYIPHRTGFRLPKSAFPYHNRDPFPHQRPGFGGLTLIPHSKFSERHSCVQVTQVSFHFLSNNQWLTCGVADWGFNLRGDEALVGLLGNCLCWLVGFSAPSLICWTDLYCACWRESIACGSLVYGFPPFCFWQGWVTLSGRGGGAAWGIRLLLTHS